MGCSQSKVSSGPPKTIEHHASLLGRCWEMHHGNGEPVESRWFPYDDKDNGQRPNYAFTLSTNQLVSVTASAFLAKHHLAVYRGVEVKVDNATTVDSISSDTILQSTERGFGGNVAVAGAMISLGAEFSKVRSAGPGRRSTYTVVVVKVFELELVPSQHKERGYTQHEVDTDITKKSVREQFGEGIITQIVYGGYLVIDTEQENFAALQNGIVARAKVGVSPGGGGEVGGHFAKMKDEGAKSTNFSIRRVGGDAKLMPSNFTNVTIEKVLSNVDAWIKDLIKNPSKATPISLYLQTYPGIIRHVQRHQRNFINEAKQEVTERLHALPSPRQIAPYNAFYSQQPQQQHQPLGGGGGGGHGQPEPLGLSQSVGGFTSLHTLPPDAANRTYPPPTNNGVAGGGGGGGGVALSSSNYYQHPQHQQGNYWTTTATSPTSMFPAHATATGTPAAATHPMEQSLMTPPDGGCSPVDQDESPPVVHSTPHPYDRDAMMQPNNNSVPSLLRLDDHNNNLSRSTSAVGGSGGGSPAGVVDATANSTGQQQQQPAQVVGDHHGDLHREQSGSPQSPITQTINFNRSRTKPSNNDSIATSTDCPMSSRASTEDFQTSLRLRTERSLHLNSTMHKSHGAASGVCDDSSTNSSHFSSTTGAARGGGGRDMQNTTHNSLHNNNPSANSTLVLDDEGVAAMMNIVLPTDISTCLDSAVGSPTTPAMFDGRSFQQPSMNLASAMTSPLLPATTTTSAAANIAKAAGQFVDPNKSMLSRLEENDSMWRITQAEINATQRELDEAKQQTHALQLEADRIELQRKILQKTFLPGLDDITVESTLDYLELFLRDPSELPDAEKDLNSAASWLPCAAVLLNHPSSQLDVLGIHADLDDKDAFVLAGFLRGAHEVLGQTCRTLNFSNNELHTSGAAAILEACMESLQHPQHSMNHSTTSNEGHHQHHPLSHGNNGSGVFLSAASRQGSAIQLMGGASRQNSSSSAALDSSSTSHSGGLGGGGGARVTIDLSGNFLDPSFGPVAAEYTAVVKAIRGSGAGGGSGLPKAPNTQYSSSTSNGAGGSRRPLIELVTE